MKAITNPLLALWLALLLGAALLVGGCSSGAATEAPETPRPVDRERPSTEARPGEQPMPSPERDETPLVFDGTVGDELEVRRPWVQVRNGPSESARAIALAYGNDVYPVLRTEGAWVEVQLGPDQTGWLPLSASQWEPPGSTSRR